MIKKIILVVVGLVAVGVAALFYFKGQDHYDPTKYEAEVTDGINVGSKISFTLPDQFDKPHALRADTQTLILAFQKGTGKTVRGFLDEQPDDYLATRRAMFLADISPIPVVIRNSFALPTLQKRKYPVVLIYEAAIADSLKDTSNEDKIAVVSVRMGVVQRVQYVSNASALAEALN